MKRRALGIGAVVAAIAMGSAFETTPAEAGAGGGVYVFTSDCSGSAAQAIYSPGISFSARDMCRDGHSGVAQWKVGSSSTIHSLWAPGGAGDIAQQKNSYNSSTTIHLRACTGEYGSRTILVCSSWKSV